MVQVVPELYLFLYSIVWKMYTVDEKNNEDWSAVYNYPGPFQGHRNDSRKGYIYHIHTIQ